MVYSSIPLPDCTLFSDTECLLEYYNFFTYIEQNWKFSYIPLIDDYTFSLPTIAICSYLILIINYKWWYKQYGYNFDGPIMLFLLQLWNLFLSILSFIMAYKIIPPLIEFYIDNGWKEFACCPTNELYKGVQFFWVWIFGLSKYIELVDTIFLMLRKKPISFLHWYHHTTVLLYVWVSTALTPGGVGYIFAAVNCLVHFVMYFYYFLTSCGFKPGFGRIITNFQIFQMIIGLANCFIWSYYYFFDNKYCNCAFSRFYIAISFIIYGSYFLLFLNFYFKRYISSSLSSKKVESSSSSSSSSSKNKKVRKKKNKPKRD